MKKSKIVLLAVAVMVSTGLYVNSGMFSKTVNAAEIMVYKSPTCGCCNKWVKHLQDEGFTVKTKNIANLVPVKNKYGVNPAYQSCHTAKIGKYFIEGHVPASDIKRLLKEKPDIKGLTVPGMVVGSPGMEQGSRKDRYDVLAIDKNDNYSVYSSY